MKPPSVRLILTDAFLVTLFALVALSPLRDPYGGWRWAVAGGLGTALGLGVAHLARRLRFGPWLTALATLVVYLGLGPALATPDTAGGGVAPTPEALRALISGLINAWRDSLTMLTPLGHTGTVLVVPYVMGLVGGVVSGTVLWRTKRAGGAALLVLVMFVLAAAFGSRVADLPLVRGLVLAAGLLIWLRWRSTRSATVAWTRRLLLTSVVVIVAGVAATGASAVTAGPSRDVLRDHVDPPFDPLDYPSPLSRFRAYIDDNGLAKKALFTTTGLKSGERIRLATMDTFDGIVWNVAGGPTAPTQSGSFGRFLGARAPGTTRVSITIGDYAGPWVPTVGETKEATATHDGRTDRATLAGLLYNPATGTMAQLGGVQPGTTYRFQVKQQRTPDDVQSVESASGLSSQAPPDIGVLTKRVQQWITAAGGPSGGALAQTLTDQFRQGYFSDGKTGQAPSAAGHGVKRIVDLVTPDQMVGDAEQYASAMGVAAQLRGLPARVVMGFVVQTVDSRGVGTVLGNDVDAWVEVNLAGFGWVPFAPTPDKDRTPQQQKTKDDPKPQPSVLQPPVVPDEPIDDENKAPQGAGKRSQNGNLGDLLGTVLRYGTYAVGTGVVTSPIWGLLLAKRVRRRRRRSAPDPVARVSGGWKEIADRARDLGTRLPSSNTRYESSVALSERYPDSDVTGLALVADRHVFGPGRPSDEDVASYWADVDTALKRLRKSAPWWRRSISGLNPVSLPWRTWVRRHAETVLRWIREAWSSRPARAGRGLLADATSVVRRKRVKQ